MTLRVAIAAENLETDGEIYRDLLEVVLGVPVERFTPGAASFRGWKTVYRLAPLFLELAADAGFDRALLAIDNDGGAKRRPEHAPTYTEYRRLRRSTLNLRSSPVSKFLMWTSSR